MLRVFSVETSFEKKVTLSKQSGGMWEGFTVCHLGLGYKITLSVLKKKWAEKITSLLLPTTFKNKQ